MKTSEILSVNGKKTIYPLSDSDKYMGFAKRVKSVHKLEIKPEDYCESTKEGGNYTFLMYDKQDK